MPSTFQSSPSAICDQPSAFSAGWIKGPDGWEYTFPDGAPPPPPPGQAYVWITDFSEGTCNLCASRHGGLFGTHWTGFPPAHPNCRCSIALIPKPQ